MLWHLTSLDAPLVAGLWCRLLARRANVAVEPTTLGALVLAVWMLYVMDRLVDGARDRGALEERHRFHRRHRRAFAIALCLAAPVQVWLVMQLSGALRLAWLALGVPLAVYFALIHATRVRLPKELAVALFFAAACAMPAALRAGWEAVLQPTAFFALLCWVNGVAIARWENDARANASTRWGAEHLRPMCTGLVIAASAFFVYDDRALIALACALAAAAFWLADTARHDLSTLRLRVLADAALLTPLAILPWVTVLHR